MVHEEAPDVWRAIMLVDWRFIPSMMSISPPAGHDGPSVPCQMYFVVYYIPDFEMRW